MITMLSFTIPAAGILALRNALGEERAIAVAQALEHARLQGEAELIKRAHEEMCIRDSLNTVYKVGREKQLDPLLLLAVIAIESRYNPLAESHVGAQGLMQVMTSVHQDKFDAVGKNPLDPGANIAVGATILRDCINPVSYTHLDFRAGGAGVSPRPPPGVLFAMGLRKSVFGVASSLVGLARTRLELLALEAAGEKARLLKLLGMASRPSSSSVAANGAGP